MNNSLEKRRIGHRDKTLACPNAHRNAKITTITRIIHSYAIMENM